VPAGSSDDAIRERALSDEKVKAAVASKQVVKVIVVPGKLVKHRGALNEELRGLH